MVRYSQHMYTILIQKMHSSGIIRYNDVINDMTFFSKAKFTKLIMVNQNHSNCGELLILILDTLFRVPAKLYLPTYSGDRIRAKGNSGDTVIKDKDTDNRRKEVSH